MIKQYHPYEIAGGPDTKYVLASDHDAAMKEEHQIASDIYDAVNVLARKQWANARKRWAKDLEELEDENATLRSDNASLRAENEWFCTKRSESGFGEWVALRAENASLRAEANSRKEAWMAEIEKRDLRIEYDLRAEVDRLKYNCTEQLAIERGVEVKRLKAYERIVTAPTEADLEALTEIVYALLPGGNKVAWNMSRDTARLILAAIARRATETSEKGEAND